jgi:hypothetical protein
MPTELDETQLLAAAAEAEVRVSPHQLKRWRRAGLVPRPRIKHVSGVRGSRALYPAWAVQQLIAVHRLHRTTRGLDALLVAAWWDGLWVDTGELRGALTGPLETLSEEARAAHQVSEDPYEAADRLLADMADEPRPSNALTLIRSRVSGRADLLDLMWTFIVIGMGGDAPWDNADLSRPDPAPGALKLLAQATGVERAMTDDPLGNGAWLPADFDLVTFIGDLRAAGAFDLKDLSRHIREASDEQLAQARRDALLLSRSLARIGVAVEALLGDDAAGLGMLRALDPDSTFARVALIRSALVIRDLVGDTAIAVIAELVQSVLPRADAIVALRAALPQHSELLRHDYADRVASLPAEQAQSIHSDVAEFLASHPAHAAALAAQDEPLATPETALRRDRELGPGPPAEYALHMKYEVGQTVSYQDHRTGQRHIVEVEQATPGGPVTVDDLDADDAPMQYETTRVPTDRLRNADGTVRNSQGRAITFPEHDLRPE